MIGHCNWPCRTSSASKGQLISKAIFHGFHTSKNQRNFVHFFAVVSKMDQIKKIQALYHTVNIYRILIGIV